MTRYRHALPTLGESLFITDGGLETTLVFEEGFDLPEFAAFVLMESVRGRETLKTYYRRYLDIAADNGLGIVLETPTWRASYGWGEKTGHTRKEIDKINHDAVQLLAGLRDEYQSGEAQVVISGSIGPRGDGYVVGEKLTARDAEHYHANQIATLSRSDADLVTAFTLNYAEEAIGIARAAVAADIPVVLGFTVETDGRLPSGQGLCDAIREVDEATAAAPAYYMINCAHPTHFQDVLAGDSPCLDRIRAVRANASCKSHSELDESTELDDGHPDELGEQYREIRALLKNLNVVGGCCGTDHRHVGAIVSHWEGPLAE